MQESNKIVSASYELETCLSEASLRVRLLSTSQSPSKLFSNAYKFSDLPEKVQANFKSIEKVYEFLKKEKNIRVDGQKGILVISLKVIEDNEIIEVPARLQLKEERKEKQYSVLVEEVEWLKREVFELRQMLLQNKKPIQEKEKKEDNSEVMEKIKELFQKQNESMDIGNLKKEKKAKERMQDKIDELTDKMQSTEEQIQNIKISINELSEKINTQLPKQVQFEGEQKIKTSMPEKIQNSKIIVGAIQQSNTEYVSDPIQQETTYVPATKSSSIYGTYGPTTGTTYTTSGTTYTTSNTGMTGTTNMVGGAGSAYKSYLSTYQPYKKQTLSDRFENYGKAKNTGTKESKKT